MRASEMIRRSGVAIRPHQTIGEAAAIMEETGVGSLVVVDDEQRPVGIVTDRDLVRRAMARGMNEDARVDSVMSSPVVTVEWDADSHDALALFGTHSLRRLAVVREKRFVGMVTVDDLLVHLTRELLELAHPVGSELRHAHRDSTVPATVT